ncbi:AraC family transcriptional regulator [Oxalobacteraceae bacterium OM1]|nr:AraC family transcriptional regulator [Oxalobacteraceae bacterium OM1]
MDLLADVLHQSGLQRRILNQRVFDVPTALAFPCDKSFGFHVVTQGEAYIHTPEHDAPIALRKGDVAMMARGCDHVVSTSAAVPKHIVQMADAAALARAPDAAGAPLLALVSGAYQVWNTPVHPFFAELPRWYVLRADEMERFDQVELAIDMLAAETARPEVGSDTVTQSLLDIIFTQLIRKIIAQRHATPQTWSHALQNAQIKSALELMHGDCAYEWTLDELARRVGLSRAGFAQKFKTSLGAPPLHYLTTLRVQKAMELLARTDDKIEAVSFAVGYKDPFSFSKVFKKLTGMPPKEFRLRDRRDKTSAWRFQ